MMVYCVDCNKRKEPDGLNEGGETVFKCPKCGSRTGFAAPPRMPYYPDDIAIITRGIASYGGSFMKAIGSALAVADIHNQSKIQRAWGCELAKYLKMGGGIK